MNWTLKDNKIYKDFGEIHYQIVCKLPLEDWLEPTWFAYRCEGGLVMVELCSSLKLEDCIKSCNRDSKVIIESEAL